MILHVRAILIIGVKAINPPTFKSIPYIEDKYLLGPLLEWLRRLVDLHIVVRKLVEKNTLAFGKPQLCLLVDYYSGRYYYQDVDRAKEFMLKH